MKSTAVAFLVLALAACQRATPGASAPAEGGSPSRIPASLRVSSDQGGSGPFAIGGIGQLRLDASFPATPGRHAVRIDAIRPDRGVHASLVATAEAGPDGTAAVRQVLEVAGSPIEQYHLVGTWSFALSVDDGPPLVAASAELGD